MIFGCLMGAGTPILTDVFARLPLFSIAINARMITFAAFGICALAAIGIEPHNETSPPSWVGTPTLDHLAEVSVVEPAFWQELATSVGVSVAAAILASAVINTGSSLGGGTTTAERLAEKGQFGAAVNALASDAAKGGVQSTAAPAAPAIATAQSQNFDTSRDVTAASGTPVARADVASAPAAPREAAGPSGFGPPPALFLGVAALCALIAFVAHRRLRRA